MSDGDYGQIEKDKKHTDKGQLNAEQMHCESELELSRSTHLWFGPERSVSREANISRFKLQLQGMATRHSS